MSARFLYVHAVVLAAATGLLLAACGSDASDKASGGPPSCTNGVKDEGESGTDCGGVCPITCTSAGVPCVGDTCKDGPNGVPGESATDGKKNNGETDVDCGGAHAPKCADGKGCLADGDCVNAYCSASTKTCATPRPDDGVKNGDETDVDCGGSKAPKCAVTKGCAKHEDCASDACSYAGKCIARKSCVLHHGGDTCGPTNAQGDCCESLDVPRPDGQGGVYTLDKYVVTAGRMRAFVERTNGDIRGWVKANRPASFLEAWDDYLPTTLDDPDDGFTGFNGVYQQLGPWALVGNGSEPANRGCNVEGPGARTYWVPKDINDRWEDRQRYPKDDLDEKALICVTQYMMSAFCAWDGGRLPSVAEISYAFTGGEGRTYPWGNSPAPGAFGDASPDAQSAGTPPASSKFANHGYNWWSPAELIDSDYSVFVAPPGRFPDGDGKFGHSDLGGLVLEWTSNISGGVAPAFWNGSWEIAHPTSNSTFSINAASKYYATGARCAR
jgi:formylglycine-generating enzyme required for sulfatase activity